MTDTWGIELAPDPAGITGNVGARLSIPTHLSPGGGQTTHPCVVYIEDGWNGYRYWMAHTPYPSGNDDHEDPNVCASNDGVTWVVPDGLVNPIDDQDGDPEYNSDVDLKMGPDNTLFLFWRTYDSTITGSEERLFYTCSTDGVTWTPKVMFYSEDQTVLRLVSPTLVFEDGHWVLWSVDAVPSPNRVVRLESLTADPAGGWTDPTPVSVGTMQSGKEPWHLFITRHAGHYVGLLADCTTNASGSNGDLLFLSSTDGKTFRNSGRTVVPHVFPGEHDQLYRSTLAPAFEDGELGYRVWYVGWKSGPPSVWNVYRTWIGAPRDASGVTHPTSLISPNEFQVIPVSFPTGQFVSAPHVNVSSDSTRLTLGWRNVTKDGFELLCSNWTTGNVSTAAKLYWGATPK